MTVEELLEKLIKLARDGKGQWRVWTPDCVFEHPIETVEVLVDEFMDNGGTICLK